MDTVLKDGISPAISFAILELRGHVSARQGADVLDWMNGTYLDNGAPYIAAMVLAQGFAPLAGLVDLYIVPALSQITRMLAQSAHAEVQNYVEFNTAMIALFIVLQILFQVFVYGRVIRGVNEDLYQARAALGLLPDDLIKRMPKLQAALNAVFDDEEPKLSCMWAWRGVRVSSAQSAVPQKRRGRRTSLKG